MSNTIRENMRNHCMIDYVELYISKNCPRLVLVISALMFVRTTAE